MRSIQHAGHTDDAVLAELGDAEGGLRHGVEGIGDDDDDAVWGVLGNLLGGRLDYFEIRHQQIVTAHARLAGEPGGDDRDVGIRGGLVLVRAGNADIVALDGTGLEQIKPLALRNTLHNVHEDDIGEFLVGNAHGAIGADITGTHNCDFLSQNRLLYMLGNYPPIITWCRGRGMSILGCRYPVAVEANAI